MLWDVDWWWVWVFGGEPSPDSSGNPLPAFFRQGKIEADSGKKLLKIILNVEF